MHAVDDPGEADTRHWFGIPFAGCDVPHWLPFLAAEECQGPELKLTLPWPGAGSREGGVERRPAAPTIRA